jgi:hypothetical protein
MNLDLMDLDLVGLGQRDRMSLMADRGPINRSRFPNR